MKDTQGVTASLLHPENRPETVANVMEVAGCAAYIAPVEGSQMYTEAFAMAMVEAAFRHGWYKGHADGKLDADPSMVEDRTEKYMALSPCPARFAAAMQTGRAA